MAPLLGLIALLALSSAAMAAKIGCVSSDDCYGVDGMQCVGGSCSCPRGQMTNSNGTTCVEVASYVLSPCEENSQCQSLFAGFRCHPENKVCDCLEGYRYLEGRCWPVVGFGGSCLVKQECYDRLLPLSLDCVDGACACRSDHYQRLGGQCRRIVNKVGASCTLDADCRVWGKETACVGMKCQEKRASAFDARMQTEAVEIELKTTATKAAVEGDACDDDADCSALKNSECSDYGACACRRGYHPSGDRKTCIGDIGQAADSCASLPMTFREDGVCLCNNGFFYDPYLRGCIKPARNFRDSCVDDDSCYTFGAPSVCVEDEKNAYLKVCDCDLSVSYKDEKKLVCVAVKGIDSSCTEFDECPQNARCVDDFCKCDDDFAASIDNTRCLNKNLNLGEKCEKDEQCGPDDSECADGVCSCAGFHYEDEGVCRVGVGGPCGDDDDDCRIANSSCVASLCKCDRDLISVENECLKPVESLGDPCKSDAHCWENRRIGDAESVTCEEGKCRCTETHHQREDACWRKTALGEACKVSLQCYTPEKPERTACRNSVCSCDWEYVRTFAPDGCKDAAAAAFDRKINILLIIAILSVITFYNERF